MAKLNEKQFIEDIWDVLQCNDQYITQKQFNEKYHDYFVEVDCSGGVIRLADDNSEYELKLQKTWADNS